MPKGESVVGVATGRGWAAAATDKHLLRVFTASGLQVKCSRCLARETNVGDDAARHWEGGSWIAIVSPHDFVCLGEGGRRGRGLYTLRQHHRAIFVLYHG